MPEITVQPVADEQSLPETWIADLQSRMDQIRQKAYEIFEAAGKPDAQDLDHWIQAERLLIAGNGELADSQDEFEVQIAVPGFVAQEIEIRVLPDTLLVRAETKLMETEEIGTTHILFRRFAFPEPIDTNRVTANLDKGVLHIVAYKATAPIAMLTRAATA